MPGTSQTLPDPPPYNPLPDIAKFLGLSLTDMAIRGALTVVVLLVALVLGRWLARRASRMPVPVEVRLARGGRLGKRGERTVVERQVGAGPWLGRLTTLSVWLAAAIAITYIWLARLDTNARDNVLKALQQIGIQIVWSLVVIACTLGVGNILQRGFLTSLPRTVNRNLATLGARLVYVGTLAVGAIIVLTIWGTGIAIPVTLLGALAVALSISLQDVLKNLVAGVYLLLEHPFVIGDHISLTPYTGEVEDIQLRYTALITPEGERVLIPNSMLFSSAVVNLSAAERQRVTVTVTLPDPGPDGLERTEEQIRAALAAVPAVLRDPGPEIRVNRAASGTVDLHAVFWLPVGLAGGTAAVYSDVIERVRAVIQGAEVAVLDSAASATV
jgi:small-conductance mechanosensitive channel